MSRKLLFGFLSLLFSCWISVPAFADYAPNQVLFGGNGTSGIRIISGTVNETTMIDAAYSKYSVPVGAHHHVKSNSIIKSAQDMHVDGVLSVNADSPGGGNYQPGGGPAYGWVGSPFLDGSHGAGGGGGGCGGNGGFGGCFIGGGGCGGCHFGHHCRGICGSGGGGGTGCRGRGHDTGGDAGGNAGEGGGGFTLMGARSIFITGDVQGYGNDGHDGAGSHGGGGGGGSGAAACIYALKSIVWTGALHHNGGHGGNGTTHGGGGGGGGGGMLIEEAPTITDGAATIQCHGGAHGGGDDDGTDGDDGTPLKIPFQPTLPTITAHAETFGQICQLTSFVGHGRGYPGMKQSKFVVQTGKENAEYCAAFLAPKGQFDSYVNCMLHDPRDITNYDKTCNYFDGALPDVQIGDVEVKVLNAA